LFLLQPPVGAWTQRDVPLDRAFWDPAALRRFVYEHFGVDAIVLHDGGLAFRPDRADVLLEALSVPKGWAPSAAPELPHARPWQRPGWYTHTSAWLDLALGAAGERRVGSLEQRSTYDRACVLHADTDAGGVFVKAGENATEARVAALVWRVLPHATVALVAAEETAGVLVTRRQQTSLHREVSLDPWLEAVRRLAEVHRSTALHRHLTDLGLPDVHETFEVLPERLAQRLADAAFVEAWAMEPGRRRELSARWDILCAAHDRIAALALPEQVVHGDAHPMNVLVGDRGAVWFDWSETGRGHPLTDIGWFLGWLGHPARTNLGVVQTQSEVVRTLWDAYVEALGLPLGGVTLQDAVMVAFAHRVVAYDRRFRGWEGAVVGKRPQYVPYALKQLQRVLADTARGA
jgi:aminoglycoside phosphotransferase (APT) family kinase protein